MVRGFMPVVKSSRLISSMLTILILLSPCIMTSGQSYPIVITGTRTLDMGGNVKTSFARGTTVVVEVTIRSQVSPYNPSTPYLLIVEIFDSQGYVVFIGFVTDIIDPGASKTAGSGYQIPAGAATGTYTVRVFVWNGWPSQMGQSWEALATPGRATFTVT